MPGRKVNLDFSLLKWITVRKPSHTEAGKTGKCVLTEASLVCKQNNPDVT